MVAGLKSPELIASMTRAGFEPMPMSAKDVAAFMVSESPKWLAVAKSAGVKGDRIATAAVSDAVSVRPPIGRWMRRYPGRHFGFGRSRFE